MHSTGDIFQQPVRSVAIFRALYLGDMLCATPAFRAIRAAYPEAHITLIGLPWEEDLLRRFPNYFDAFIEFPGWPGLPEQEVVPELSLRFLEDMQQRRFDLVFQMQGNGMVTNVMCMLFNAHRVTGLRRPNDYAPYHDLFPVAEEDEHEILKFLKLLRAVGIPDQGTNMELPIMPEELQQYEILRQQLRLAEGQYLCVHPGARDSRRRWPAQNFARLITQLGEQGFTVLLTGSKDEAELLRYINGLLPFPVTNLVEQAGHVPLGPLAALIRNSRGLISNDTGVSHIAAALQVPSVVFFSPYSAPHRWAPLNRKLHLSMITDPSTDAAKIANAAVEHLVKFEPSRRVAYR